MVCHRQSNNKRYIQARRYYKCETETIKSSLCHYSDAFILVTGKIAVAEGNKTDVGFKNCTPFSTCKTVINDVYVDEAIHATLQSMPMYNLIEYSDNYSDTSGNLWQFKRDEIPANNADLNIGCSQSFKSKAALVGKTVNLNDGKSPVKDTKIVVPLKYFSNVWRLLIPSWIKLD